MTSPAASSRSIRTRTSRPARTTRHALRCPGPLGQHDVLDIVGLHHRGGASAPTASSLSPASNATAVVVASNVTATFSEAVIPSTISFVLKTGSTTVSSTVTYDVASRVVTLDPNSNLSPGTIYTATLSGAQDLSGNTMVSTSWSFTTATADTTAPTSLVKPPPTARPRCPSTAWSRPPSARQSSSARSASCSRQVRQPYRRRSATTRPQTWSPSRPIPTWPPRPTTRPRSPELRIVPAT